MTISGNDHLLELNELFNIGYDEGDGGAMYAGADLAGYGVVYRHNFFHHLHGPYTYGAMAVYLDDAASGATIYGNVFYKASHAAFIGGGRDNIVENNIMVDCSHGNSNKNHELQPLVADNLADQILSGNRSIIGAPIENPARSGVSEEVPA